MAKRISVDEYFMEIAKVVAKRSTCLRRQIGAVIVKNKIIVSTGYNGAPRGLPHCLDIGCIRDELGIASGERHEVCRGVHAEQNALIQAGRSAEGATLYVNAYPCKICAKLIINAGIKRVVVSGEYSDTEGLDLLRDAGVEVVFLKDAKEEESASPV
ncbi:MAG TPA: cytidine deaminase [Methanomicrobia archaeon]|nr:cytidine deaminase [Methanomicrobia archaeon]HEX59258.1 cytidine deaminase [Methanomicrobia archaeon]